MQERFIASTKYNDLKGTVAADNHDNYPISSWLEERGLLKPDEHIIGITVGCGEISTQKPDRIRIYVSAFAYSRDVSYDNLEAKLKEGIDESVLRRINAEMTPNEFFTLFKRFDLAFSYGGILNGLELAYHEDPEEEDED